MGADNSESDSPLPRKAAATARGSSSMRTREWKTARGRRGTLQAGSAQRPADASEATTHAPQTPEAAQRARVAPRHTGRAVAARVT
eukprot:CAMPEP_0179090232 /NCGR_PEP_ID=MMETSP0796-20121207/41155_1 /TAXON_ID=73915 /ORGANISM="Pyrodinium bahamense, Strain pbaha01" /LENGTH=85 /DNA_ID=CAMNT_0020787799 /DNA_START=734 /DNA_END=988 /DNA_ORIENTATION=+